MKNKAIASQGSYNRTKAKENFLPPEPTSGRKPGNAKDIRDDPKKRTPANSKKASSTNQYDSLNDGTKAVKRGYAEKAEANYEDTKGNKNLTSTRAQTRKK